MTDYTLPELAYDYSALAPSISGAIMELHHSKHHQAYVTGANTALAQLAEARDTNDLTYVNKLEKDLAFNLGGHINHSIFWTNMSPNGGDKPTGDLASAIDDQFGSFDRFTAHFTATAMGVQGSFESLGRLIGPLLSGMLFAFEPTLALKEMLTLGTAGIVYYKVNIIGLAAQAGANRVSGRTSDTGTDRQDPVGPSR